MSANEATDYEQDAIGQHQRWVVEFAAARKALEHWQKTGDDIDKEFRNELLSNAGTPLEFDTRLPLFTSDTLTLIALLYGQVPQVVVSRRFGDSGDDKGRVAGEILERLINTDITKDSDTFAVALQCALLDFFLPGFAQLTCRYDTGEIVSEEVAAETAPDGRVLVEAYKKDSRPQENVDIDYVPWKDWLWGPAKVPHLVPWWAHCADMTRAQMVKRFGPLGKLVPLAKRKDGSEDPWSRAKVWQVYEKDAKKVYWFCESFDKLLDMKDDPLQLEGFYPFPPPLVANLTTSKVVPRPYYALHQDQYRQINTLMSRIRELVDAVRVSGLYDATQEHIPMLLKAEGRGRLLPVKNWPRSADSGGIAGSVDWFPIEPIVQAIAVLQQQLTSEIDLLHQTTGFSDIMRGEATQANATATEQRVKTKFGSIRIQRLQDEIARFATDVLKIKAEIICKHFAPETIMERANVRFMPEADQQIAMEAIALLKSDYSCYRVEVKPEAVALADFSAMKQERGELLNTLTAYFQAMQPIVQAMPAATTHLLKIAQWTVAGVRGSSQIEGVFDQMIQQAENEAAQKAANRQAPPPDPKLQAEQIKASTAAQKGQFDMQKEQLKHQNKLQELQAETMAHDQQEQSQARWNVQEQAQKALIQRSMKPAEPPKPGFP